MYPEIEPYASGLLDVGDGNRVYWETCGAPAGKPALMVHGGPGSGCSPSFRRFFDPARYRIVLFDQRNCGRSLPPASDPATDLAVNNTSALVDDMERLREHLEIDRWLVCGGSWGSTLSLAYAERHPDRVSEMVLFGVTTGRHSEVEWAFRGGLARHFPEQWKRLAAFVGEADVVGAIARMLADPSERVRREAARAWCMWESAPATELAPRFRDPDFAFAFARIVTHYMSNHLFLEDGVLMRGAGALAGIDGVLIGSRGDLQAPLANAEELARVWPRARLVIVDEVGHGAGPAVTQEIVQATDRFARDQARSQRSRPMKFVTRKNAAVDRIACPWLIRRFVDANAEFLYAEPDEVQRVAREHDAIPFDVEGAELGHVDGRCSFESILLKFKLDDPGLAKMAKIVHGADVEADLGVTPEAAGLKAIAMGFRRLYGDRDLEKLEAEMGMYDALYEWCQWS